VRPSTTLILGLLLLLIIGAATLQLVLLT